MKKIYFFITVFFFNVICFADIELQDPVISYRDDASVQRGAKFFATTCMVCHSLKYLTFDPIAKAAGIDYQKMPIQAQEWWADTPPPDLSLIAKARGRAWLYTYLHGFYQDNSRPTGTNNLLLDNSNMPNPFVGMQGVQRLVVNKNIIKNPHYEIPWYTALELVKQGTMPPEEFDKTISDVVNFLTYASDPERVTREQIGIGVILFLIIFVIVTWLLKREYWR